MIKPLEWDSAFFGYNIGLIESSDVEVIANDLKNITGYRLIYVYSPIPVRFNDALRDDWQVVYANQKVTFGKEILNQLTADLNHIVFLNPQIPLGQLYELALQSGHSSRFKIDSRFVNGEFEALYHRWVSNSINEGKVIVAGGEKLNGFISYSIKQTKATIELFAVDSHCRGTGIGTKLLEQFEAIALSQHCQYATVATQMENLQAVAFYQKNGFKPIESYYIYHLWNKL